MVMSVNEYDIRVLRSIYVYITKLDEQPGDIATWTWVLPPAVIPTHTDRHFQATRCILVLHDLLSGQYHVFRIIGRPLASTTHGTVHRKKRIERYHSRVAHTMHGT